MQDVHISTLRLEPHRVRPPDGQEYYGPPEGVLVWRVFVDDEKLSDGALPFSVTNQILELFADIQFPIWGDGSGYISVRRVASYVIWADLLDTDDEYYYALKIPLSGRIFIFDASLYALTINQTPSEVIYPIHKSPVSETLPELVINDLRALLAFPDPELALYRTPEREHDNLGTMVLRRVSRAVHEELDVVSVSQPPSHYTELRIGFDDLPDFYESVWHIGKTDKGVAIRFIERPHFPFWLCGVAFDKALGSEPFLQT